MSSEDLPIQTMKRTRLQRGRSRNGCIICLNKHIKCDERSPECRRCVFAGLICPGPRQAGSTVPTGLFTGPGRTRLEKQTFQMTLQRFIPDLKGHSDDIFWKDIVLASAHAEEPVLFKGIIGATTLYYLPMTSSEVDHYPSISQKYQRALQWYRQSLKAMRETWSADQTLDSITLSLTTILIYALVEMRQPDSLAQSQSLVGLAFEIVAANQRLLWNSKSSSIYHACEVLLDIIHWWAFDCTLIPRDRHETMMMLCLHLGSEFGASEVTILQWELCSIMYDLTDTVVNELQPDTYDVDRRIYDWHLRLLKYHGTPIHAASQGLDTIRMRVRHEVLQVIWNVYQSGPDRGRHEVERLLLKKLDSLETGPDQPFPGMPVWMGDTYFGPICLFIVWYLRSKTSLVRITQILEKCRMIFGKDLLDPLIPRLQAYLVMLTRTEMSTATDVELRLFGRKPGILLLRHAYMIIVYLATSGYVFGLQEGTIGNGHSKD